MPVSPSEALALKQSLLPTAVTNVWDRLIASNLRSNESVVKQDDAVEALIPLTSEKTRAAVFASGWLEIEDIYRQAGWKVAYDKPSYCENYPATFTFKAA
ncbi:hypothetical protein RPALISO_125 [Ruegeria phage RpAliso]|nr:hypothetical protein RPALISO_125 [Ruegeria phage RpAliso]